MNNQPTSQAAQTTRGRIYNSISVYMAVITSVVFFLVTLVMAASSYQRYENTFYNYRSELCIISNAQAAYYINGDTVETYAASLTIDNDYLAFVAELDELRARVSARCMYIVADTGAENSFTYIYDAPADQVYPGNPYALGIEKAKNSFPGAEEVLATGIGFSEAVFDGTRSAEGVYYAYAPITNSAGEVVAFVGTDVDLAPLREDMQSYRADLLLIVLGAFVLFLTLSILMMRRYINKPLYMVTESAVKLAEGNINLRFPKSMTARKDEIGLLAQAFEQMAGTFSTLIADIERAMRDIRNGYLHNRASLQPYQGEYHRIIAGVNATLDVMCRHLDVLPDGVAFYGPTGDTRYSNSAMRQLDIIHGLSAEEGAGFLSFISKKPEELFEALNERGTPHTQNLRLADTDGAVRHYAVTLLPIFSDELISAPAQAENGGCYMLLVNGVTTLAEAKEEALRISRAKSEFLSRMSHEIRTPLNAVMGMAQIAQSSEDLGKIQNCLEKITDSSEHLLGIINDILVYSKLESGQLALNEALFSLKDNMDFVASVFQARAAEKSLQLRLTIGEVEHDGIFTDSLRLNQVLFNLLSNAVKFTPEGGTVEMEVVEESHQNGWGTYRFTVRDTGIGIEKSRFDRLFEPFEQTGTRISSHYGGTGLGLSIAKSIVEMMGGTFALESEIGKGSAFSFAIHVRAQRAARQRETLQETWEMNMPDFTGRRVLVVDDIAINREIIVELLRDTGIAMDTAENGKDALDKFLASEEGEYDVILMDMQMPVMDGCDATEAIRASVHPDAKRIKIIAMTANVFQEDVQRALRSGMDNHLSKPVEWMTLLDALLDVLT